MSFEALKQKAMSMDSLVQQAEQASGTKSNKNYGDDRLWKPSVDKAGNGYAVIRFLPAVEGDQLLGLSTGIISFKVLLVSGM